MKPTTLRAGTKPLAKTGPKASQSSQPRRVAFFERLIYRLEHPRFIEQATSDDDHPKT